MLKKLEKEAEITKRNEDIKRKWEKLERIEIDHRKGMFAKSL